MLRVLAFCRQFGESFLYHGFVFLVSHAVPALRIRDDSEVNFTLIDQAVDDERDVKLRTGLIPVRFYKLDEVLPVTSKTLGWKPQKFMDTSASGLSGCCPSFSSYTMPLGVR